MDVMTWLVELVIIDRFSTNVSGYCTIQCGLKTELVYYCNNVVCLLATHFHTFWHIVYCRKL